MLGLTDLKMGRLRNNGRGGQRWFTIEAKSYNIFVETVGRRKRFFVTKRSKGVVYWIQFEEDSLRLLLKGIDECCREKVSKSWRL